MLASIRKMLERKQDQMIDALNQRLTEFENRYESGHVDLSKEVLRIQLLQGIDTRRLSESETLYFFDKYKALGGNSFVEDRVIIYLEELRREREVN